MEFLIDSQSSEYVSEIPIQNPPLVTIVTKPGMTQTHFLGALVPRLTFEVERGTCVGKVKRYLWIFRIVWDPQK